MLKEITGLHGITIAFVVFISVMTIIVGWLVAEVLKLRSDYKELSARCNSMHLDIELTRRIGYKHIGKLYAKTELLINKNT